MNRHTSNPPTTINDAEWQLQELARRSLPDADADSNGLAAYRAIDRALRTPPASGLPGDFAASIARLAERQHVLRNDGFEQTLIRGLIAGLGLSGGVALAIYAGELMPAVAASVTGLGDATLGWAGAALACIGVSWLCSRVLPERRIAASR